MNNPFDAKADENKFLIRNKQEENKLLTKQKSLIKKFIKPRN